MHRIFTITIKHKDLLDDLSLDTSYLAAIREGEEARLIASEYDNDRFVRLLRESCDSLTALLAQQLNGQVNTDRAGTGTDHNTYVDIPLRMPVNWDLSALPSLAAAVRRFLSQTITALWLQDMKPDNASGHMARGAAEAQNIQRLLGLRLSPSRYR